MLKKARVLYGIIPLQLPSNTAIFSEIGVWTWHLLIVYNQTKKRGYRDRQANFSFDEVTITNR